MGVVVCQRVVFNDDALSNRTSCKPSSGGAGVTMVNMGGGMECNSGCGSLCICILSYVSALAVVAAFANNHGCAGGHACRSPPQRGSGERAFDSLAWASHEGTCAVRRRCWGHPMRARPLPQHDVPICGGRHAGDILVPWCVAPLPRSPPPLALPSTSASLPAHPRTQCSPSYTTDTRNDSRHCPHHRIRRTCRHDESWCPRNCWDDHCPSTQG